MTLDQLRVGYIMPGDLDITLVGFSAGKATRKTIFPGIAGSIDMNDFWQSFVGAPDFVIDPIAVYGSL